MNIVRHAALHVAARPRGAASLLTALMLAACSNSAESGGSGGGFDAAAASSGASVGSGASGGGGASSSTTGAGTGGGAGAGGSLSESDGPHLWSELFGDTGWETTTEMAVDPSGGIFLYGMFGNPSAVGPLDFGGGSLPFAAPYPEVTRFLVKLDPSGQHIWSQSFSLPQKVGDTPGLIAADASGGLFLGTYTTGDLTVGGVTIPAVGSHQEAILVRLDASGEHLWSKRFATPGLGGAAVFGNVIVCPNQDVYFTSQFSGILDFGTGPLDGTAGATALMKLDVAGNIQRLDFFGQSGHVDARAVGCDAGGNVFLVGAGIDLVGGAPPGVSVVKLDPSGTRLWSYLLPTMNNPLIEVGVNGDVLLSSFFSNPVNFGDGPLANAGGDDVFVAKIDTNGNYAWSRPFGGTSSEGPLGLTVDAAGNVILGGFTTGDIDFGGGLLSAPPRSAFLVKLSPSGDHIWSKVFGTDPHAMTWAVGSSPSGNVFATGNLEYAPTNASADFGGGLLTSKGSSDIFVAAFAP